MGLRHFLALSVVLYLAPQPSSAQDALTEQAHDESTNTASVTYSKYGTLGHMIMRGERESYADYADPVDAALALAHEYKEHLGIKCPDCSLFNPTVQHLTDGSVSVKFMQTHGNRWVHEAQLAVLFDPSYRPLWINSTLVPAAALEHASVHGLSSSSTDASTAVENCLDDFGSNLEAFDARLAYFDHNGLRYGSAELRAGFIFRATTENSGTLVSLVDEATCSIIDQWSASRGSMEFGVGQKATVPPAPPECIRSTFPYDSGSCDYYDQYGWPNQNVERLWDLEQTFHSRTLSYYSNWEDWRWCRESVPYDDGFYFYSRVNAGPNNAWWSDCSVDYHSKNIIVGEGGECIDQVGHEVGHSVQRVAGSFQSPSSEISNCLVGETADIIGELYQTTPDWLLPSVPGDPCNATAYRSFENPSAFGHPDSYKWFDTCSYTLPGSCNFEHGNIGILTHAAYGLASPGSKNWYGVSFDSIGLDDTRELFWDLVLSSSLEQNYEMTGYLLRTLAANKWGSSSQQYHAVSGAVDAVGIWG